jgi:hypothetical protein
MKLLLSVGAIALTLTFSAYAEPPHHTAMFPDFYKCFDLLRLEGLQHNYKTGEFHINTNDPNQVELFHSYIRVTSWLRGYFTAMNVARSFNGLTPDATNGTTQEEWMPWIFSYCRSHPTENLEGVADELVQAFSPKTP